MKKKFFFILLFALLYCQYTLYAQGCVAIRGNAACGIGINNSFSLSKGSFDAQLSYRYFKSFRHYRGDVQETYRLEQGTEVINNSSFVDLGFSYGLTNRLYINAILPFARHRRSSMYEHGGNPPNGLGERHTTSSRGLSDIRLGIGYWLFNPDKHPFNYAFGIGIKLPTGKYDYTDTFYNQGQNRDQTVESVVDQSIQLGDGGTGITLDIQGIHPISSSFSISTNLFYLFNHQSTNGIRTRNGRSEFSSPDQFAARIGGFYNHSSGLNLYFGGRVEGVPATDIIGSSAGYRRPGYALSVEPGAGFSFKKFSVFLSTPLALYRNRIQSYEDKQRTSQTGMYRHGDAAFADYLINLGISYRFEKSMPKALGVPHFEDLKAYKSL